jgi:hypothetical protein
MREIPSCNAEEQQKARRGHIKAVDRSRNRERVRDAEYRRSVGQPAFHHETWTSLNPSPLCSAHAHTRTHARQVVQCHGRTAQCGVMQRRVAAGIRQGARRAVGQQEAAAVHVAEAAGQREGGGAVGILRRYGANITP